jgi:hypothetical protein
MADQLTGKRVAALATHGFEQDELLRPRKALEDAGAKVDIVSPESGKIRGWKHKQWGDEVSVDRTLEQAKPSDYDALLLPDDIPAFNRKMLEEFAEGKHGGGGNARWPARTRSARIPGSRGRRDNRIRRAPCTLT